MLSILLRIVLLCGLLASGWAQALQLSATRLWPSPDYTRITLEATQPVAHKSFTLANPDRLVVDLEGVEPGAAIDALTAQLAADDPYIAAIRAGVNRPGVMRLVIDLKTPVKASIFQLQPLGQYGHRLVVDLYPVQASPAQSGLVQPNLAAAAPLAINPVAPSQSATIEPATAAPEPLRRTMSAGPSPPPLPRVGRSRCAMPMR